MKLGIRPKTNTNPKGRLILVRKKQPIKKTIIRRRKIA